MTRSFISSFFSSAKTNPRKQKEAEMKKEYKGPEGQTPIGSSLKEVRTDMDEMLRMQKVLFFLLIAAILAALFYCGNLPREEKIVLAIAVTIATPIILWLRRRFDSKCTNP